MSRKPRIHYPGALYHVMVKGNNGEDVFKEKTHKNRYLEIIGSYKEKIGFKVYAYCIMDNHAHILVQVIDVPLSIIMQRIQQVYTGWFNRKYVRTGHVFQQRYKALLCDKDNYLLQLIKYIHNNPVKAKLDGGIDYRWSSHISYIGRKTSDIVDTSLALNIFSEDIFKARRLYLNFMEQEDEKVDYIDIVESKTLDLQDDNVKKDLIIKTNIDKLMKEVSVNENKTISEIIQKTKIQEITDIRKAIVYLSCKYCDISNKILAEKLNLSPSMISKIKSENRNTSKSVKEIMGRWEESK